jgi:hypothetical protein
MCGLDEARPLPPPTSTRRLVTHLNKHVHDLVLLERLAVLQLLLDLAKQLALVAERRHDAQRPLVVDEALLVAVGWGGGLEWGWGVVCEAGVSGAPAGARRQ